MTATIHAIRVGARRGIAQFAQVMLSRDGFANAAFFYGVPLLVLLFLRGEMVGDTDIPLAAFAMPGALAAMIAYGAVLNPAYYLAFEREDGTLLRMKVLPTGMVGYLAGRVTQDSIDTLVGAAVVLVGGLLLLPGLSIGGPIDALFLLILVVLGLLAMIPIGLIVGAVIRNPRLVFTVGVLALTILVVVSGVWFPIQELPGWIATIAQAFPVYWLGLGMRSVFLPEAAAALELGGSWRVVETLGVLGAWAVGGLVAAPRVLRRMAARESGSAIAGARERALQRG